MFTVEQFQSTGSFQSGRVSYVLDDTEDYVDIDTPEDFARAELLVKKHCSRIGLDFSSKLMSTYPVNTGATFISNGDTAEAPSSN